MNENCNFLNVYITKGYVNGKQIDILRDTRVKIDLACEKYLNPSSLSDENVGVKQPSQELVCLPLTAMENSGNFGTVQTQAAACGNHLNQHDQYLLGNKTAELIKEREEDSCSDRKGEEETIIASLDADDSILISALLEYVPELPLLKWKRHLHLLSAAVYWRVQAIALNHSRNTLINEELITPYQMIKEELQEGRPISEKDGC
ncbi:hypothetical protein TNCV_3300251 [Trichonephila clavipes]|nr:hypothetical protein TNCV_3300251 [Trichonephila clavipes]